MSRVAMPHEGRKAAMPRLLGNSPLGFNAGDTNLYRYVGNSPTNATDPSGLWTWKIGPKGQLLAVAEKGDTLLDLINKQGYDEISVAWLSRQAGITDLGTKFKVGFEFDITRLLPGIVQDSVREQQQTDYELIRARIEFWSPKLPKVPKGQTIGTSGIDLAQPTIDDQDTGKRIQTAIADNVLGLANCHGFTGMMLGARPPLGIDSRQFSLGAITGEPFANEGAKKPGVDIFKSKRGNVTEAWYYPEGGLFKFLTSGRKITKRPDFRDVALFFYEKKLVHSAVVLGRSNNGEIYLLQKLNSAMGIVVTTDKHPIIQAYEETRYYGK